MKRETNIPRTMAPVYRVFAGGILLICVVVYTKGVQALMKLEQSKKSPLVSVISPGQEYSVVMLDGKCLAYFESNLDIEKEYPTFEGAGTFYTNFQGQSLLSELSFKAEFASYYRLEDFEGQIEVGTGKLELSILEEDDRLIEVLLQLGTIQRKLVFPRPEPIFLQQAGEKYSLRFPRNVESNLISYTEEGMTSSIPENAEILNVEEDEAQACLLSLRTGTTSIPVLSTSGIVNTGSNLGSFKDKQ